MKKFLLVAVVSVAIVAEAAAAPQLIVGYDFESSSGGALADKSGFGTSLDLLLETGASVVNDAQRGEVLQTSSAGFGGFTLYDSKLDFTTSFTLQAWVRVPNAPENNQPWQHIAGRPGSGARMFNHWGLGAIGDAQKTNPWRGGWEPVNWGPGGGPDGEWHHLLLTWNHVEGKQYGYWDGINGNTDEGNGILGDSPVTWDTTELVTHEGPPGLIFSIGGDPFQNVGTNTLPNTLIDDVGFWNAYAPPEVVAGLSDGTYTIINAPLIDPSPPTTGDYNGSGTVDAADYVLWRHTEGQQVAAGSGADGNADGMIDQADYDFWRARFGNQVPAGSAALSSNAVPEPSSIALVVVVLMYSMTFNRRHNR